MAFARQSERKMAAEVGPLLVFRNDESVDEDDLERQEEVLTISGGIQPVMGPNRVVLQASWRERAGS